MDNERDKRRVLEPIVLLAQEMGVERAEIQGIYNMMKLRQKNLIEQETIPQSLNNAQIRGAHEGINREVSNFNSEHPNRLLEFEDMLGIETAALEDLRQEYLQRGNHDAVFKVEKRIRGNLKLLEDSNSVTDL